MIKGEDNMIKPERLKRGDKVAIVSLSSGLLGESAFIHKYKIAKERLEKDYGLQVVVMENALKGIDYLYKNPQARAKDLMTAFSDKTIKAIFCAIGGDDTIRLLPYIDFEIIRENPKIFTGFSDTTTNHFMMRKAGLVSYYGLSVMNNFGEYGSINDYTKDGIDKILFNPVSKFEIKSSESCSYDCDKVLWGEENIDKRRILHKNSGYKILQGNGKVTGELFGGCADVFFELIGTSLWLDKEEWKDKILLLETSEENMSEDNLCWLLRNLNAQGIFDVIKGIVVGKPAFSDKEKTYPEIYKKVVGFEANRHDLPILFNVNIGHAYPIGVFPLGLNYEIDCENKTLTLLESGTK